MQGQELKIWCWEEAKVQSHTNEMIPFAAQLYAYMIDIEELPDFLYGEVIYPDISIPKALQEEQSGLREKELEVRENIEASEDKQEGDRFPGVQKERSGVSGESKDTAQEGDISKPCSVSNGNIGNLDIADRKGVQDTVQSSSISDTGRRSDSDGHEGRTEVVKLTTLQTSIMINLCELTDAGDDPIKQMDVAEKMGSLSATISAGMDRLEQLEYVFIERPRRNMKYITPLKRPDGSEYKELPIKDGVTQCPTRIASGYEPNNKAPVI